MKALLVSYCPRGERSRTKKLLRHAQASLEALGADIELLDIASDVPDLFTPERLAAYYERNYGGKPLTPERLALLKSMDQLTAQFQAADVVVLAYPMYNFSQPAIVKAWFDSVMQAGVTWRSGPQGSIGLAEGKKALVISTCGKTYEGRTASMEHCVSLSKVDLAFMGCEAESVFAMGLRDFPDKEAEILEEAKGRISRIIAAWFPSRAEARSLAPTGSREAVV